MGTHPGSEPSSARLHSGERAEPYRRGRSRKHCIGASDTGVELEKNGHDLSLPLGRDVTVATWKLEVQEGREDREDEGEGGVERPCQIRGRYWDGECAGLVLTMTSHWGSHEGMQHAGDGGMDAEGVRGGSDVMRRILRRLRRIGLRAESRPRKSLHLMESQSTRRWGGGGVGYLRTWWAEREGEWRERTRRRSVDRGGEGYTDTQE
ncbi:hypothetical protein B0H13DRAFT_1874859 [Mycena leptocephala]|nr:hypothetical protein B0H13DRAFT_1874859 [Mycena leptocephala]